MAKAISRNPPALSSAGRWRKRASGNCCGTMRCGSTSAPHSTDGGKVKSIPKLMRKDFTLAVSLSGSVVDDPDQIFYESYICKSPRNYTGYCDRDMEALVDKQSMETHPAKRKQIVWEIEKKMA